MCKQCSALNSITAARIDVEYLENVSSRDLDCGIKNICKVIPNLSNYISPSLNVAYNLQKGNR